MEQQFCTVCHFALAENFYFCPNCGKQIHQPPLSTAPGKQLSIYVLSILLPPLGLWPGIRYLRQRDQRTRIVGWVAIGLTILSSIGTVWLTIQLMNTVRSTLQDQLQFDQGF